MPIPVTITQFLSREKVEYQSLAVNTTESALSAAESALIDPGSMLVSYLLKDEFGLLVALIPASHTLDIRNLNEKLNRSLEPVKAEHWKKHFPDCEVGIVPALATPYGIKVIMDRQLFRNKVIYFQAGTHSDIIRMNATQLQGLLNAWQEDGIARPRSTSRDNKKVTSYPQSGRSLKERVQLINQVPAIPEIAQRLLRLRSNPNGDATQLSEIINLDPSISAQVLRYARSPYYGFRGNIKTTEDAIIRVLGYEMVMNIAIGLAVSQAFSNPPEGPLGLKATWRNAVYCASLAQTIANQLTLPTRPIAGLPYLTGMLHNFGYLLLGHFFQPEFYWLNRAIEQNPTVPVEMLEKKTLGTTHMELGAWLMQQWSLPDEIVIAVGEHHNPSYHGQHALYPQLILAANRLLARLNIGHVRTTSIPETCLQTLGLSEAELLQAFASVSERADGLDSIAAQLAA